MNAKSYWQCRAIRYGHLDNGLPAVCSYGMPRLYNEAINLCQSKSLLPWLNRCRDMDVLDIGCGVGRWSHKLARRNNRVVGVDISPRMVELAYRRCEGEGRDCRFLVQDVTDLNLNERFDFILAVTVLQHILDESALSRVFENIARHLKDSGTLILLEVAPGDVMEGCNSDIFEARSLSFYRSHIERANLELVEITGVDIAPLRTFLVRKMGFLPSRLLRTLATMSALLSLPVDLFASRYFPDASWHKMLVIRHVGNRS